MKVRFKESPIVLGLAYSIGAVADLSETQAKELIETGFAEAVEDVKTAEAEQPKEIKKAVKRK